MVNAFSVVSWCLLKIVFHVSVNHLKILQGIHGLSFFYRKENMAGGPEGSELHGSELGPGCTCFPQPSATGVGSPSPGCLLSGVYVHACVCIHVCMNVHVCVHERMHVC